MTLKKVLLRGVLGIPFGVFIMALVGLIVSLFLGKLSLVSPAYMGSSSELTAYTVQFVLSCVISFVFALSSLYFQVEKWSIARQTFMHFITVSIVYLPIAIYLGWLEFKTVPIIIFTLAFFSLYVMIWLIQYAIIKMKIQRLNEELNKK